MSIQSIMKQVKEKSAVANDDLADATNSTRPMRMGNKKAAQEALEGLKNEYRRLLLSTAAFIVLTGPGAKELGALASPENKAFSSDSEELYREVVSKIDPRAYLGQATTGAIFGILGNSLEEVAREIGIVSYPNLRFKSEYSQTLESPEQFVELAKRAINESLGAEAAGIYAVNSLLEEALKRNHGESFTPVLLTTTDDQLAVTLSNDLNRLSPNVFVVSVGKASKTIKNLPNSISIKEASPEALNQLLEGIRARTV